MEYFILGRMGGFTKEIRQFTHFVYIQTCDIVINPPLWPMAADDDDDDVCGERRGVVIVTCGILHVADTSGMFLMNIQHVTHFWDGRRRRRFIGFQQQQPSCLFF